MPDHPSETHHARATELVHALNTSLAFADLRGTVTTRSAFLMSRKRDVCVFVGFLPTRRERGRCRAWGARIVLDGTGLEQEEKLRGDLLASAFDVVLVTDSVVDRGLYFSEHRSPDTIWTIPHPFPTFDGVMETKKRKTVQGLRVRRLGIQVESDEGDIPLALIEYCHIHHLHCIPLPWNSEQLEVVLESLRDVDALIVPPPGTMTERKLHWVFSARNLPVMCALRLGIPTILYPFASFLEAATTAHYPAFARSMAEVISWIDTLRTSRDDRLALGHLGRQLAREMSVVNIAARLADKLRRFLC